MTVTLYDEFGRALAPSTRRWERPLPPATPVAAWDYAAAKAALEAQAYAEITPDEYTANRAIAELRDHWDDGCGWMGPNAGGTGEVWRLMKRDIERQFTPVDVVGEALTRFANALLKREPNVSFVPLEPAGQNGQPSPAQATEAEAARRAIGAWWDREKLWRKARKVVRRSRWATRGTLRVVVDEAGYAKGADGKRTLPEGLALDAAFARVSLSTPEPTDAAVVTDLTTGERVAVLLYARQESERSTRMVNVAQLWTLPSAKDRDAEGRPEGRVRVREIPERGTAAEYRVPIDRLPIAELAAELLLTDAVRRQQRRLNFAESTVVRGTETAGFPERYFRNAEPEGVWFDGEPPDGTEYAKAIVGDDGKITRYLIRKPPHLGGGVVTHLIGIETGPRDQKTGEVTRAMPDVTIKEPSDPEYILKTSRHSRGTVLQSVNQGHVLRESDRNISGYSQEQARGDFEDDATNLKAELEALLRDVLEAALAWALAMTAGGAADGTADGTAGGEVGRDFLTRFRCVVDLHVSTGPLSADERRSLLEAYDKGLLSKPTVMTLLGVEDVDAELALLASSEDAQLGRLKALAEALAAIAQIPGGSVASAARTLRALGYDPKVVRALVPRDTDGGGDSSKDDDEDDAGDLDDETDDDLGDDGDDEDTDDGDDA